jgi:hypothetical protein
MLGKLSEPRIHFALACAAYSCPVLNPEVYVADKLHIQLEQAAYRFINDAERNRVAPESMGLNKIFEWNSDDFTKRQSLVEYVGTYSEVEIYNKDVTVEFLDFNWTLYE